MFEYLCEIVAIIGLVCIGLLGGIFAMLVLSLFIIKAGKD